MITVKPKHRDENARENKVLTRVTLSDHESEERFGKE